MTLPNPLTRFRAIAIAALACLLLPVCAGAQDFRAPVAVRAEAAASRVAPGGQAVVAVILEHAEHWHTWPAAAQDVLPPAIAEFALRTEITVNPSADWVRTVGPVQWPATSLSRVADPTGESESVELPTYSGRAVAFVPLIIDPDAAIGARTLTLDVFYQACDEKSCLAPTTESVQVEFEIVALADASAPGSGGVFAAFDPAVFASMSEPDPAAATPGDAAPTPGRARNFFGIPVPRGEGLWAGVVLALLSALGGLILNLTPCVLPVIPIKVMTISQHAGSPGRSMYLGLWMAAGVVAFWFGVGLPVAFVSTFTDPSRLFGIWWVTLGIGVLIALMGVGIMGLFTINLPKSVYMVNPKADSAGGSFLFGVMTAVLGLPCFGFVAGALLAGSAALPTAMILVIFAFLGVGMALPYLVLSARPSLVERIPRTGPASELVKQVMGLLLLAAAAYFVGAGLIGLTAEKPWMAKQIHWWAVALFAALAGLWLLYRSAQITKRPLRLALVALAAAVLAGASTLFAIDSTRKARDNYLAQRAALEEAGAGGGALVSGAWIDYSPALLERALAEGRTVVLDFTAEWCLNCKALKATVLNRDPVKSALRDDSVISMTVDLTSTKAPGWEKLRSLGQTGIPLLVVYGPGLAQPWQSNAYTPEQVMDALAAARGQ